MFSLLSKFHPRKALFAALICVFLALAIRPLFAASIVLPDGSTFTVDLVSHGGGSYTYQVSEVSGKDLSHWLLDIGLCFDHITDIAPATGLELGPDPSTDHTGVKWNVNDGFTTGLFTITLDAEYPIGSVTVVAKTGNAHGTATVDGPVCIVRPPQDPEPPTPTNTPQDDPTATATTPGGTIPPATATATATQENGTIPPPTATQPGGTIPPATASPTTPTSTPEATPTCWLEIGDRIGNICTPTPAPPVTVTVVPPTETPTQPDDPTPTPTATTAPTNEEDGPEPRRWYNWLPIVRNDCEPATHQFGCGSLVVAALADPVIESLPVSADTMISSVSDSLDECARARLSVPWIIIAQGHGRWVQFNWEPGTPDCFMDLLIQSSDTDVFTLSHLQRSSDAVTCEGSTIRRVTCSASGADGPAWVRARMEARGLGAATFSAYEASSGLARLYDVIVAPNFLGFMPFTAR